MVDQTANFVRGRADAIINAGDTTISVVDASEFPDPTAGRGEYNLVVWDAASGRPDQDSDVEIVRVTGRDTTADGLTVTRAQEGTTDVSHPSDSALQLAPTAKIIDDIVTEKADTDRAVEDFTTAGADRTIPRSQGGGSLAMESITEQFDSVTTFSSDGTFDASNTDLVFVEAIGGGGGGGGAGSGGNSVNIGGSGGGGAYAAGYADVSADSSISVTVGSGGAGGPGQFDNGSDGGNSSFGTTIEAGGGGGGGAASSSSDAKSNNGGDGVSGDILLSGGDGNSKTFEAVKPALVYPGPSGGPGRGAGGIGPITTSASSLPGADAGTVGVGGIGGMVNNASTHVSGGAGADGIVIIHS